MTKTKYFSGRHGLRVLGIAGLLITLCGFGLGTALAEKNGDTSLDESAKDVGNNFGSMLHGMGQELKKVIGSDDKATKKDEKNEKKQADDKSDKDEKSKK